VTKLVTEDLTRSLGGLKREGLTIMLIEHDIEFIGSLADAITVLSVTDLTVRWGAVTAVDGVSLTVGRAELVALVLAAHTSRGLLNRARKEQNQNVEETSRAARGGHGDSGARGVSQ
jgi:ABC-type uncharacterized transport system ATPase subunit